MWSIADEETLAAGQVSWTRILVEIVDGAAETAVDAILAGLDDFGVTATRLLRGEEAASA